VTRLRGLLTEQKTVAGGVAGALVLLGVALYPALPDRVAFYWLGPGEADGTVPKLVAVLFMPAVVVFMSLLFERVGVDADNRVVGSLAMLLLLVVQVMVFMVNLGVDVPVVPVSLALVSALVAVAVWLEVR
jgi:uncharacterized membrane protein